MSVPEGRFAPIRTAMGSGPEKATMQLLHQTWRSRIDRLNVSAVTAGSSGKYGDQQRFSASTSSDTSSVRQKRYDDTPITNDPPITAIRTTDQCFVSSPGLWGTFKELTSLR